MSARLAQSAPERYSNPAKMETFFSVNEVNSIQNASINREHRTDPKNPCDTNLFIGVFFDGTGNNYAGSF
ncbi:hypothetical protein, partial [Arhodomonas sp. KWT]|uniref:hypothetical protein n=1 Tax=Arhodomonas sp. KWT TaxID=2679915 RepID=UPI0013D200B5